LLPPGLALPCPRLHPDLWAYISEHLQRDAHATYSVQRRARHVPHSMGRAPHSCARITQTAPVRTRRWPGLCHARSRAGLRAAQEGVRALLTPVRRRQTAELCDPECRRAHNQCRISERPLYKYGVEYPQRRYAHLLTTLARARATRRET
jgi:hypothetical protein